jgi:YbbR domain-containing protein
MKRFIREYLLEHWSLKLTALLLSLILWLFVRGEPGPERVVAVPVEVQVPSQMEITNERPTSVEVTMRGAAFSNMWFSQPLPTCSIDLQGSKEGEHVITLTPENIRTPKGSGIEVLQVNPTRVTLVLERTVSKEVLIVVPIRGEPSRGFEIYGKSSKPAALIVTGPLSHIDRLHEAFTEPVSVSGQKQPVRAFVALNIKDSSIRTSLVNPVQVDIQIGPRLKLATVTQVPLALDDSTYTIIPKQISIQVSAPVVSIADLKPADFQAIIETKQMDLSKLPAKAKPHVSIVNDPSGVMKIREVLPAEVIVRKKK